MIYWFVAILHSDVPQYITNLDKYIDPSAQLIIGYETAKDVHKQTLGQHIHVAADMDPKIYAKFHDNIHKKKMQLKLKASDGIGKQCGRVKDVRDHEKMLAYCVKDENLYTRNISKEELQRYIDKSFKKSETWEDQVINQIITDVHFPTEPYKVNPGMLDVIKQNIEVIIIDFYRNNSKTKAVPARSYLKKLTVKYLLHYTDVPSLALTYII